MRIYGMRVNHLAEPLGFRLDAPRMSWKVLAEGKRAASSRVRIFDGETQRTLYDTGWRADIDSLCFEPDLALTPRTRYLWDVQVRTDAGEEGISPRAAFETGKMQEGWQGRWITAEGEAANVRMRRDFRLAKGKAVRRARLYICGLGLYEAYLNGAKVGEEYLAPGCTAYDRWIQVQTYDVTDSLAENNALTVLLGDGWYKGRFGFRGQKEIYGAAQALLCELRVTYADGTEDVIASDAGWQAGESPVRFANIYDGETYDASLEERYGLPVRLAEGIGYGRLSDRLSPPVKVMETLRPAQVLHTPKGETVLDMGQVMTGWITFRDPGKAGHEYRLSYGEVLQEGCFYNGNLRTARQEFTYVSGGREEWARPHFTFYGFRYVKLEGFDQVDPYDFVGQVLYSAMEQVGFAHTGQEKVNRLIDNVRWGQKGNFLDVPTDCPQRDERMGWTGDAQAFCATACYQMDSAAFYTKYLHDMAQEQSVRQGAVPHVIPAFGMTGSPSCAWADAAAIIPWTLYLFYGDRGMLRTQYTNMTQWVGWLRMEDERTGDHRLWRGGHHFADWLALDAAYPASCTGGTEPEFIASAYYLYSVLLTAKAARALGREADAADYDRLAGEIRAAIRREYFTPSGRLAVRTQTACILTLFLGLAEGAEEARVCAMLNRLFEESRMELRTGFVGTAYLCRVLSLHGFGHLAYTLFLREEYPGWLYEVNMGATTVWERWNSILPDGRISDTGMNSLNHYAYGAVLEWLYRDVAAIAPLEEAPGFRRVRMAPHIDPRLGEASFGFESPVGRYESAWQVEDEHTVRWQIAVPFGGEAELALPPCQVEGDVCFRQEGGEMRAVVAAGRYDLRCRFDKAPWAPMLMDTPLRQLLADEAVGPQLLAAAPHLREALAAKAADINFHKLREDCFSLLPAWEMEKMQDLLEALSFA